MNSNATTEQLGHLTTVKMTSRDAVVLGVDVQGSQSVSIFSPKVILSQGLGLGLDVDLQLNNASVQVDPKNPPQSGVGQV